MSDLGLDRPTNIHLGGADLPLPLLFPSVSSIKTNLAPIAYVQLLVATGTPQFLVSAYDVANSLEQVEMTAAIDAALGEGTTILLDSGNYESYWMQDTAWTRPRFHEVLKSRRWPIAFSFDVLCEPETPVKVCAKEIADSCFQDQLCHPNSVLLPIVHGLPADLPDRCGAVAGLLNPLALAVPERDLGDGIFTRMRTVQQIRLRLNQLGAYYPLHLLGTGNPRSVLLYAAVGADIFDGLEWCQTVADPKTAVLNHFQQRELLDDQTVLGEDQGYSEITLVHNLFFYGSWMRQLHGALASKSFGDLIQDKFPPATASKIETIVHGH